MLNDPDDLGGHTGAPDCPECARIDGEPNVPENVDEMIDKLMVEYDSAVVKLGNFLTDRAREVGLRYIAKLKARV